MGFNSVLLMGRTPVRLTVAYLPNGDRLLMHLLIPMILKWIVLSTVAYSAPWRRESIPLLQKHVVFVKPFSCCRFSLLHVELAPHHNGGQVRPQHRLLDE